MRRVLALLALAAGCIGDNTIPCGKLLCPSDTMCAGSGSATSCVSPDTIVKGRATVRDVANNASRLPVSGIRPLPFNGQFVVLDDGSKPELTWNADGTFEFVRSTGTQAYRIVDGASEVQLTTAQPRLLTRIWGRSNRVVPDPGTVLQYTLSNVPPLSNKAFATIDSTGLWTQTNVGMATSPTTSSTLDWTLAYSLSGEVGLLDTNAHDRVYYIVHDVATPGNYTRVSAYRFDDVSMTSGTTTVIGQPLFALPADTCVVVDAPIAKEIMRVKSAGYSAAGLSGEWRILAVPAFDLGPEIGFSEVEQINLITDTNLNATFGTPFGGYELVLEMSVSSPHGVSLAGATPANEDNVSTHWVSPTATSSCSNASGFSDLVAVPRAPAFDGIPIDADQSLSIDRGAPASQLTWTTSDNGVLPHVGVADVFEVTKPGGATHLTHNMRLTSTNVSSTGVVTILIDPSVFTAGTSYVFSVTNQLGFPNASAGDLSTIGYPYARANLWTGVLTIAN